MPTMRKYEWVLSTRHWRLPLFSFVRKEVVQMRDYEILIVVFTVIAIIVSILVEYIKNDRPPTKVSGHLLTKY